VTSAFEQELREQGDVLRRRVDGGEGDAICAAALLHDADHVVVAARGTSDNAARYAQYLLGQELRLVVALATPSLFRDLRSAPRLAHAAVIGISQSGQSPDIVGVLAAARAQGRPTLALTNDPRSPLASMADVVIPLLAGPERSVPATKSYTASLFAIAQLAEALAPLPGRRVALERLPEQMDAIVEEQLAQRDQFDVLAEATLVTVLGRGLHYATAHETALKVRELTAIAAEAFSPPDLVHGPIAALGPRSAAWLTASERHVASDVAALWSELRQSVRATVAVARDPTVLERVDVSVRLPDVPEWAAPLLAVIPGQAAALRLAEARGVDVDSPHGLRKITLTI
jgi:glucosamine--fructose-6-phosphate aminotransferase (isomerizing)